MPGRTLVASASNLLFRGYFVVPTDRRSRDGAPVNALFAVARAIHRAMAFKTPLATLGAVLTSAVVLITASWRWRKRAGAPDASERATQIWTTLCLGVAGFQESVAGKAGVPDRRNAGLAIGLVRLHHQKIFD